MSAVPTTAPLALSSHESRLSLPEIEDLITIAQAAPSSTHTQFISGAKTGETREIEEVVWEADQAADWALSRLIGAFLPLIHSLAEDVRESAQSRGLTKEDAFGALSTEFIDYARNQYQVGQSPNFIQVIHRVLSIALSHRESEVGLIRIPKNAGHRFHTHMREHDQDPNAAYRDCKAAQFRPETFKAILDAIGVTDDPVDHLRFPETYFGEMDGGCLGTNTRHNLDATHYRAGFMAEDPADAIAQLALISFAFAQVSPKQETLLRLKFGFDDLATRNLRLAAGFDRYEADVMTDKDVATCAASTRPTVQREIARALTAMREAIEATDYDGVSHRSTGRE